MHNFTLCKCISLVIHSVPKARNVTIIIEEKP